MFNSKPCILALALLVSSTVSLFSCKSLQKGQEISHGEPVESFAERVINLDQNWTTDTQQAFYFTSQGSRIMPYEWFLVLEQANSNKLFRSNKNIESLRYLPAQANSWNPDGLPVGFAKDKDHNDKNWIGLTCAACHTTQIDYQGTQIRIDGGPTLGDFETFNQILVEALSATYQDPNKFTRFAKNILGTDADNPSKRNQLRSDLLSQTEALAYRNQINHSGGPDQPHYGFGRLDAIGAIFNKIMVQINEMPVNIRPADAPASYPFLWGTHQSNIVQWTGFAPNGPATVGALTRNGGEVLGVYGTINIPEDKHAESYRSSLAIKNLGRLEAWVAQLKSPAWPDEYLPPINQEKAARGEIHYDTFCSDCHQVVPRNQEGRRYSAVLTAISELKTDPTEWNNMQRVLKAGKFEGRKTSVIAGTNIPAETTGLAPLVNAVIGSLLEHPTKSVEAIITQIEGGYAARQLDKKATTPDLVKRLNDFNDVFNSAQKPTFDGGVYKARPLNGIWATAPYLHNGSVPNLYELLLPQKQRSKTFFLGSREFDAKKVGFVSTNRVTGTQAFKFDTTLKGNSNQGHTYGTNELTPKEKYELLEYLKTL
ncbi:MAG: di-heme-cytochrome C peroxidase [Nitrosomonas sp.]|nr:di-heme-cytochrome C peroxidase [Nitrosomonas sp.]